MAIDTAVRANGAHLKHLQQRLQRAHNGKQDVVHRVGEWGMGQQKDMRETTLSPFRCHCVELQRRRFWSSCSCASFGTRQQSGSPPSSLCPSLSHTLPFGLVSRLMPHGTPWQGVAADNKLIKFNLKQTVAFRQASRGSRKKCFIFNWPAACGRHCGRRSSAVRPGKQ